MNEDQAAYDRLMATLTLLCLPCGCVLCAVAMMVVIVVVKWLA